MFYVIQENLFKETHYDLLLKLMERHKFEYEIVKFLPFVDDIYEWYDPETVPKGFQPTPYRINKEKVFCFGAVAMATAAKNLGWRPGSQLNDNHDFNAYAPMYGLENMLNGDGHIINFTDPLPEGYEEFFARPTKDSKVFAGQIFTKEAWENYTKICNESDTVNIITEETQVLVSPLKNIQQEIRCWVVGGKVITASRYKLGHRVSYMNYDDEIFFTTFAQEMVNKYQPADAFVLDVCLTDDGLKIVEVNNINSAGFYHCNMEKLIEALENFF